MKLKRVEVAGAMGAGKGCEGQEGPQSKPVKLALFMCEGCNKEADQKVAPLLRCGRCMKVGYCNAQCQKRHWVEHKDSCNEATKRSVGKV